MIISTYSYLLALIFLGTFTQPPVMTVNAKILGIGFLYGLVPTSLAYVLFYNGLKKVTNTSLVPVIASIEPVTAVLVGLVIYNESIGIINLAGFAIVLLSIIIILRAQ